MPALIARTLATPAPTAIALGCGTAFDSECYLSPLHLLLSADATTPSQHHCSSLPFPFAADARNPCPQCSNPQEQQLAAY